MMRIEPFIHGWVMTRRKKHGAGRGSWQQALKMGLCCFAIANGLPGNRTARMAVWMAIYGTPSLPASRWWRVKRLIRLIRGKPG